ncbi:MAG: MgtC/SapB family protein [Deltaproteobacteria bacterium]|nr:MgtC/SapB family protein [Deltaproteobacteria bacterium]
MKEILIPLGVSFLSGMILGLEREMSHKPAGLRTQVLVSLGTTLFIISGQLFGGEVIRLAANVLTGLGFLGAGVIWQQKGNVRGLTTAALIWVNGSLGVAIGFQQYVLAGAGVLLTLIALRLLGFVEEKIKSKCRVFRYEVVTKENEKVLETIHEALNRCHFQEDPLTFEKGADAVTVRFAFCNPPLRHQEFVEKLRKMTDVLGVKTE